MKYLYLPTLLIIAIIYTNYFDGKADRNLRGPASTKIEKKETWEQTLKRLMPKL